MDLRIDSLIQRGQEAYGRRDYVGALTAFREVLEERPEFADVRHLAGLCLSFLGQAEAALEEFERALALNEGYVEAHLNRAITLAELGRYDEARAAFDEAGRRESALAGRFPTSVAARLANAHAGLGELYESAGAPEEATAQYRLALALRPGFVDIRNKLAQALLELGELAEAEAELRRAVGENPRFLTARLNLGLVLYRRRDAQGAYREWARCAEQEPDHPQVRAYLAIARGGQGAAPELQSGAPAAPRWEA
jgi:tetratricopeptide (TPR) repeat protein